MNKVIEPKPQTFYIGIKAVIVNDYKALVVADPRFKGYDLPGGKIDEGESIEQALRRELKEELGLEEFKMGELLFAVEKYGYKVKGISIMLIFYKVTATINKIVLNDEHSEYRWIEKEELAQLISQDKFRNDGVKTALEKALK